MGAVLCGVELVLLVLLLLLLPPAACCCSCLLMGGNMTREGEAVDEVRRWPAGEAVVEAADTAAVEAEDGVWLLLLLPLLLL